jgi:hemolysin-activating ACP:hemolysin acyltransferase
MYPPYNLPPINPAAFGGQPQQQGPQGAPPPSSQGGGQPPMDMNKYLIDKVMEIKKRMGGGDVGALSALTEAMQPQQPQPQPPHANANATTECVMRNAFADCLNLWVTTPPYCDFPSKTIGWRLVPAFNHGRFKVWYDNNGLCTGFVTWAWMTDSEFETRKYTGSEVFARNYSDKLVFVDMIAINGVSDVLSMSRDVRNFCKRQFPDVETVWSHRGPRNGWYPNKGG